MVHCTANTLFTLLIKVSVLIATDSEAHARRGRGLILITWGDGIKDVGAIENRPPVNMGAPTFGPDERVGYYCQAFGVLWIFDIWSWGGQWCTYEGDTYYEIDEATAAYLLGKSESELSKPFLYSFPLGLICIGAFIGLVVLGSIFGSDEQETVEFNMAGQPGEFGEVEMDEGQSDPLSNPIGSFEATPQGFAEPMESDAAASFATPLGQQLVPSSISNQEAITQASPPTAISNVYVMKGEEQFGPMSMDQLIGLIKKGQISDADQFWAEGMDQWQPVSTLMRSS